MVQRDDCHPEMSPTVETRLIILEDLQDLRLVQDVPVVKEHVLRT